MKELTDIVWPEILKLARQEIKAAWSQGGIHLIIQTNVGQSIDRVCPHTLYFIPLTKTAVSCQNVWSE